LEILFENERYWVVRKPVGILSEQDGGRGLADLLATQNDGYAGVIHRLDREVSGLILYAKTPNEAARLSELAREGSLKKEYLAAVAGVLEAETGELSDLLYYDRARNKVFPVERERRGVKKAVLRYRVENTAEDTGIGKISLLSIEPVTGRTHQIRVQFASRKHPILGDRRYGGPSLPAGIGQKGILLACRKISFPDGNEIREFSIAPEWKTLVFPT